MGDVWREMCGGRCVAGDVWREMCGGRCVAGDVWRGMCGGRCVAPPVGNLFFEVFLKKTFRPKISNSVYVIWDLPRSETVSLWVRESSPPVGNLFLEVFLKKNVSTENFKFRICNLGFAPLRDRLILAAGIFVSGRKFIF